MKLLLSLLLPTLLISPSSSYGDEPRPVDQARNVAFYEAERLTKPPSKEGRLSSEQWSTIPAAEDFYVYWNSDPDISPLKSRLQAAYDDHALYLRLTALEEAPERIRATISKRGNPSLWTDDCFEIYFDPLARGVSYLVFTVNSLGTQDERKQMDAAVSLPEWRGEEWKTWANPQKDRWVVEVTLPFSDLEATAKQGDLWMLNLVRFAYTSGKFQGASWAPGGSYASPGNFGYLYFGGSTKASSEEVAQKLASRAIPPWSVTHRGALLRYDGKGKPKVIEAKEAARQMLLDYHDLGIAAGKISRGDSETTARINQLLTEASDAPADNAADALAVMRHLKPLYIKLFSLYWRLRVEALAQQTSSSN